VIEDAGRARGAIDHLDQLIAFIGRDKSAHGPDFRLVDRHLVYGGIGRQSAPDLRADPDQRGLVRIWAIGIFHDSHAYNLVATGQVITGLRGGRG